ncbi:MAG: transposase [Candidatus Omnitrophica bacterium]|nr:transposase [Candidatus Omnitrophota bacterium]
MARTARIFIENACNHIITRGNQKKDIFIDESDFEKYAMLLHKYKLKYGCLIYGYCFMLNHIHLVLESPLGLKAMSRFMHCLNQSYAMSFNAKYEKVGHLWQNRYKNFVVLKDSYLYNLITYIEYNPVRAGIVASPGDYAWSSYRARVLGSTSIILDKFGCGDTSGMRNESVLG